MWELACLRCSRLGLQSNPNSIPQRIVAKLLYQPSPEWISYDVACNPLKAFLSTHGMIMKTRLPEATLAAEADLWTFGRMCLGGRFREQARSHREICAVYTMCVWLCTYLWERACSRILQAPRSISPAHTP